VSLFNKILVANRGEIAVRVIRTARDLGIKTVAIYSQADAKALHVLMADEAYKVGGPEPADSYLNIERIVQAALISGAEAVHPGYGFLAQNAHFTRRVEEEGLVFIGPPARIQELVGDKLGARRFFSNAGVPVVPGTFEEVEEKDAEAVAEELGYPVIVKPAGGGGGIGMRIAWSGEELRQAIRAAAQLAESAFKSGRVYIEKYFPRARHIEVQVLGERNGRVVHLFERECSVQRRFQKVVEEAPSPALDSDLRRRLLELALKAARACNYVNAGTFEFLYVPQNGSFYLLELNSRIQVEHPVTELVTGVDIVREQIFIAATGSATVRQASLNGHAIEARVYAEDPAQGFVPCPGVLTRYKEPSGPWVRVDGGYYEGAEVPANYDPLLMKVVCWGATRGEAVARLRRALRETVIAGVKTNVGLLCLILSTDSFLTGAYDTTIIESEGVVERLQGFDVRALELPAEQVVATQKRERMEVEAWRLAQKLGV